MATTHPMTAADAATFAAGWIATWNDKDVETVLSHFDEAARFTSPKAAATVGRATVEGKAALRAYWTAAVVRIESIHFTLDRALWDATRSELTVVYTAEINGKRNRACEFMRFNDAGLVIEGEAMYGADLTP
jgi:hypothetical protein